jgi:hypothetical protein
LRVASKMESTFFWFLTSYRAAEIVQNDYLSSAWNFRSIEYHHAFIFEFRDFGWILTVGLWDKSQNRDSRVFPSSTWNFWSIEHNHALYWKFGNLAGLRSRPQAQMTMSPIQKTFLVLRPFEGALTCSILIAGTQVMLRKAYFPRKGSWLRPESWTPRPRTQNYGPYYWDEHTNGLMFKISAL